MSRPRARSAAGLEPALQSRADAHRNHRCIGPSITSQMPWLARFGAPPDITEKAEGLYHEAAQNTLRRLEFGEQRDELGPVSRLLLHLDNHFGNAQTLIADMLEKRDQWLRFTGANRISQIRERLEQSFQKLIVAELETLHAAFDDDVAREIVAVCGLTVLPGAQSSDLEKWRAMANLLLTKGGELRKQPDRSVFYRITRQRPCEVLLARLRDEEELVDALDRLRELPSPYFEMRSGARWRRCWPCFPRPSQSCSLVFRERGARGLSRAFHRGFGGAGRNRSPTDFALALGHRIQHILVDEFQDTSFTQFDLLEKLTAGWEPGDGSHAVPGGRSDAIHLPLSPGRCQSLSQSPLRRHWRVSAGTACRLRVNFRSRPQIVDWVNETFAASLRSRTIWNRRSGVFESARPPEQGEPGGGQCVRESTDFSMDREQAARVVELVQSAGEAPVAILVRARTHLIETVALLKRHGIPFQAIEIDQLGERAVIEDLMALTFALLHPADRVAWLAILRAPWCGLTLEDLYALAGSDHRATHLGPAASREFIAELGRNRESPQHPAGAGTRYRRTRTPSAAGLGGRRVVQVGWPAPASKTNPHSTMLPHISIF